jgi:hypothetical protein
MGLTASLAELLSRGIVIAPHEAVAIAQQLIRGCCAAPGSDLAALEPLSLATVHVRADGAVECPGYAATPAVSEIAILLDALVPAGTPHMPGGLRYAIARALLDVDAPPFDSIADFSATLGRFEQGDRTLVVRLLARRVGLVDDRRTRPLATERPRTTAAYPGGAVPSVKRVPAVAAGLVAGLSLIGIGEGMHLLHAPVHAVLHRAATPAASAGSPAAPATSRYPSSTAVHPMAAPASTPASIASPVAPATIAHRRRAVKIARADARVHASGPRATARDRHDAEPHSLFGLRFKWAGDTFAHRD